MKSRYLAFAFALALAACDEAGPVISHVARQGGFDAETLWTIQNARGIPVEIHGRPFDGITDLQLVELLRPPAGSSQDVTFYPRPPGGWVDGYPWRLVLHFNPQGAPNAAEDCARIAEAPGNPPAGGGFTLNAVFCQGKEWQAQGYMDAPEIRAGDLAALSDGLASLMQAIFREEPDK